MVQRNYERCVGNASATASIETFRSDNHGYDHQRTGKRGYVLHALHYIPVKNCVDIYTIDDIIPLYHIDFSVKTEKQIIGVRLVPEGKEIAFEEKDGRICFQLEKIDGHQMVELKYR